MATSEDVLSEAQDEHSNALIDLLSARKTWAEMGTSKSFMNEATKWAVVGGAGILLVLFLMSLE